jgi:hypothetical protein
MFRFLWPGEGADAAVPDEIELDADAVAPGTADYVVLEANEALAPLGLRFGGSNENGHVVVLADGPQSESYSDQKLVAAVKGKLEAALPGVLHVQSVSVR